MIANKPISNCGSVKIHKEDDAGTALAEVKFDLYTDNSPIGGPSGADDTNTAFSCTTDANGDCTISKCRSVSTGRWRTRPRCRRATTAADQAVNITTGGQG